MSTFHPVLQHRSHAVAGLVALTVLQACSHARPLPTPTKPLPLALAVVASSGLNPDADGRPSPVVVRIYQLTSTGEFLGAEFAALYPNDSATLGKTLVSKQEFSALPGQHDSVKLELASETRALGVLVAFRDIDHARWRVTASADAPPAQLLLGAASAALQPKP